MEPFWSYEQHFVWQEVKVFHYPLKIWNCLLIFEGALIASVTYTLVSRRIIFIVRVLPYEMFILVFENVGGCFSNRRYFFFIKRAKVLIVYLNLQSWHHGSCDQTEPEKHEGKKIPPNLAMPLGLRFDKFITGYETCFSKNSSPQNN